MIDKSYLKIGKNHITFNIRLNILYQIYNIMKSQLPIRSAIIEILDDKDGEMLDSDLLIALNKRYGDKHFSTTEINRNLLALETQGLLHVSVLTHTKRRIKRVDQNETVYLGVEED